MAETPCRRRRAPQRNAANAAASVPHRLPPPGGEVDAVYRGGELDEVARALRQRRRLGRVRGPVGVERSELLAVHGGVARVSLALHPVDGGEQLPADAGAGGDVAVQVLAPGQRRLRAGEERGGRWRAAAARCSGPRGGDRAAPAPRPRDVRAAAGEPVPGPPAVLAAARGGDRCPARRPGMLPRPGHARRRWRRGRGDGGCAGASVGPATPRHLRAAGARTWPAVPARRAGLAHRRPGVPGAAAAAHRGAVPGIAGVATGVAAGGSRDGRGRGRRWRRVTLGWA